MRDIEGETARINERGIAQMQAMKTGALISASVHLGALLGEASEETMQQLGVYGDKAGEAFQLADDILDVTASPEAIGKARHRMAADRTVESELEGHGARGTGQHL